jgi:hypothetical protein
VDYLATIFTKAITINGLEQLRNIQTPKRISYIHIASTLWLGPFMAYRNKNHSKKVITSYEGGIRKGT